MTSPTSPAAPDSSRDPGRDLTAEIVIDAPIGVVWAALTDIDTMIDGSPELLVMRPLGRGGLRAGQRLLGINRRKAIIWPTINRVEVADAPHRLSWLTTTSQARWTYALSEEGDTTRVRQTRSMNSPLPRVATIFTTTLLGGVPEHADELEAGMVATLAHLKATVEAGAKG